MSPENKINHYLHKEEENKSIYLLHFCNVTHARSDFPKLSTNYRSHTNILDQRQKTEGFFVFSQ